ncbi:MAG: 7TM diverse intracellular signaling domain-containing protein [Chitinophagaceae bacterium]
MQKNNWLFPLLIVILLIMPGNTSLAQDSSFNTYTNINKVTVARSIADRVSSSFIKSSVNFEKEFSILKFEPGVKFKGVVPDKFVTKKLLLKFNIRNPTDTINSVYFFPGFYYTSIQLYKINGSSIIKITNVLPDNPDSIGYRLITLNPFDSSTIVAELTFLKTYINSIRPRLVNINHINSFIAELRSEHDQDNLFTFLFCGLLLMMILFSMANFFQGANREFLYYSVYAFFLGAMLLTKSINNFRISQTSFFLESYLDFILMNTGIIFYLIFMKIFLATKSKYPFLYKLYTAGTFFLLAAMVTYTFFHYLTDNYVLENLIETVTKFLLLIMIIIFLVYSFRHWKDKLLRYLFWGNLCLLLFSIISFLAVLMRSSFLAISGIFGSSLFYYEIGLFLELVFFLSALNYKNNKRIIEQTKERENLKAQNLLQEYEKEIAVYKAQQEERQRISADMHDELGSGMTAIRLMSEIARNKMKENTPVEIDKISSSADDVLNKMNAIIWSMNIGNDTLDNLISYIRAYSIDYFENTDVDCSVNAPDIIPTTEITGDKRRNIFLSLKETLTNVLKHAKASNVAINIEIDSSLKIQVSDNGKGINKEHFDKSSVRQFGNGLKNIAKRMESIGGTFEIRNENGTITILELPL